MRRLAFRTLWALGFLLLAGVFLIFNFHLIGWEGEKPAACRAVAFTDTLQNAPVAGIEDLAVDARRGLLWFSAYDRFQVARQLADGGPVTVQGGIYTVPLALLETGQFHEITPWLALTQDGGPLRPHGLALSPDGGEIAFVRRSHALVDGDMQLVPSIERYDISPAGNLAHRAHIPLGRDFGFCGPNDLVFSADGGLWVTNDHGSCDEGAKLREELFGLKRAFVAHIGPGGNIQKRADGIGYANGVVRVPGPAGEELWVSATRENTVHRFAILADGSLQRIGKIGVPGAPDNLTLGPDGQVWLAVFPNLYRFAAYRAEWPLINSAPARAVRIDPASHTVTVVYEDEGRTLSGATAAARWPGWLAVTSGFDDRLILCRMPE